MSDIVDVVSADLVLKDHIFTAKQPITRWRLMSRLRHRAGSRRKKHGGQGRCYRGYLLMSFTPVFHSNLTQTEWCSSAWSERWSTENEICCCTSQCLFPSNQKKHPLFKFNACYRLSGKGEKFSVQQASFLHHCWSKLKPINTRDCCWVMWRGNDCWLYAPALQKKPDVCSCQSVFHPVWMR